MLSVAVARSSCNDSEMLCTSGFVDDVIFGRPFVKRFALSCRTVVLYVCPVLSVTLVYCGQTFGRIKLKLGKQVGLGPGHTVRWRSSSPRKGAQ